MKKGITLVECIVYLAVISLITLIFISSYGLIANTKRNAGVVNDIGKIHDLLILGKASSRNNGVIGRIIYYKDQNYIKYSSNKENIVATLEYVKIDKISTSSQTGRIEINSRGIIITPGSIIIKDSKGNNYSITISVGSDTISVKT